MSLTNSNIYQVLDVVRRRLILSDDLYDNIEKVNTFVTEIIVYYLLNTSVSFIENDNCFYNELFIG